MADPIFYVTYAATQVFTCSPAALAASSAREGTAISNTANLYQDILFFASFMVSSGAPSGDKAVNFWFYGSLDGTNYTDNASGTDAAITLRNPHNFMGPFSAQVASDLANTSAWKVGPVAIAQYFGGVLPPKLGMIIENKTGLAFNSTAGNHVFTYVGVKHAVTT